MAYYEKEICPFCGKKTLECEDLGDSDCNKLVWTCSECKDKLKVVRV